MPQWMQDLVAGWPMIRSNFPTFFVILVLILGAVWVAVNWSYSSILAGKNTQLETQDRQIADYKEKLGGATPDQAKAQIDALEARLTNVEPRRLTQEQRISLATHLRPPWGTSYSISISSEASGDSTQFAADFSFTFRTAGNWAIREASVMGLGNRPPHGIAVQFADLNQPPPEAVVLMNALRIVGIQFDIQQGQFPPGSNVALLICTKISN
jgi:hypothetical protein